jgi:hypothetical protein
VVSETAIMPTNGASWEDRTLAVGRVFKAQQAGVSSGGLGRGKQNIGHFSTSCRLSWKKKDQAGFLETSSSLCGPSILGKKEASAQWPSASKVVFDVRLHAEAGAARIVS